MTRSWNRPRKRRYEHTGAVVLNQVRLGQAPISLRRLRWRHIGLWAVVVLMVAAGAVVAWLTWDSRFYVYDAEVVGTRQLSSADLFAASGLDGLHILWARPASIRARLLGEFPSLESVDVSCGFPSDCRISVVERQPRVLWNDQGQQWWVDEDGAIFEAEDGAGAPDRDMAGRWLVRGPLPRSEDGSLDQRVRVALAELWASGADVPAEFEYRTDRGLSFTDRHGWRVVVGQGSGMDQRLRILEPLMDHLESRGATPLFVDVRFPKAPYYSEGID
ncbi:MAG: cell division protein FtsQ/DivIB [Chloroflexota bacterium]|nr:cell division protein FtsQ/DivIB [Chloroflexota bacterium]